MDSDQSSFMDALRGDEAKLRLWAESGDPHEVLHLILGQIMGAYTGATPGSSWNSVNHPVERLVSAARIARRRAGPEQREIDLAIMKLVRRSGALCAVLGAGVTVDAGGPSWPVLVRRLLSEGLQNGFERVETIRPEQLGPSQLMLRTAERVVGRNRFSTSQSKEAQVILSVIDSGSTDAETLMRGAELCVAVAGQRLFADVSRALYETTNGPGPIHKALAELAEPQQLLGRSEQRFGWSGLITYNFDDLMGEALDQRGIPRAAWAMKGGEVKGDPNAVAAKQDRDAPHVNVIHLHGYSPRRFFYITDIKFVFATSQYDAVYGADQRPILDSVFEQFLANPAQYAVYVGCSFVDERMNELLRSASAGAPGRDHWALLRWSGPGLYTSATGEAIERESKRYLCFGVQPVWFDKFAEIPGLLRMLK